MNFNFGDVPTWVAAVGTAAAVGAALFQIKRRSLLLSIWTPSLGLHAHYSGVRRPGGVPVLSIAL